MARVSYIERSAATPEAQRVYDEVERITGTVLHPFQVLAHSPVLLERWWRMMWALMTELALDAKLRELALLRLFQLTGCEYCFAEHDRIARLLGVPPEQIANVASAREHAAFNELERLVLAYTESITVANRVDDEVIGALRRHLSERELVELTFCIANWNGLARFIVPLAIELEAGRTA